MSIPALFVSIKKNSVEELKRLLDSGLSVLATDDHGNTLAHSAAEAGHVEILQLLKERGAPLDRLNRIHQTPLSLAARGGHLEAVQYLCEHGASTHGRDLNTAPLGAAAAAGHLAIVKYLVEQRNVPLNALERPFGATPLFVAARFSRPDVVRYLMEKGADPTISNAQGETAADRVAQLLLGQPDKSEPAEAGPDSDLSARRSCPSEKLRGGPPPRGAPKGIENLLSCLVRPRKDWHFWR